MANLQIGNKSIPVMFRENVATRGSAAMCAYRNAEGKFVDISWLEMDAMSRGLGKYLVSRGIKVGDKVAIFSANRYEWWVADLAILSAGAINVPVYPTNTAKETHFILNDSDARICFVGAKEQMQKVLEIIDTLPMLEEIIIFDEPATVAPKVVAFSKALETGKAINDKGELDARVKNIDPNSVATFIYTSGTTGNPKGVMLSHNNMTTNAEQWKALTPGVLDSMQHIALSFLPLSHIFERTITYYGACVSAGAKVYFAKDITTVLTDMIEVRPTIFASVPRVFEKMHAGILAKVALAPPLKQSMFNWAMSVAKRNLPYICNGKKRTGLFAIEYALAYKLIISKLLNAIGLDRVIIGGSGGGPLSAADAEFFIGMGMMVLEGFGMTETSPLALANVPGHIRPGTVGKPLVDTQCKIGEGGELLIKGPQVMLGYYKNEAATKETFTADGFLKTGDIAEIDSEGNFKITGRIKDLIITSGGKNISPQNLENALAASLYIEQASIIGDNRNYLTALIVPAFPALENWAKQNNITFPDRENLVANPRVKELYEKEVADNMQEFARVEQVKKFHLLTQEWSQDTGELTPTMKVKRRIVNQKYAQIIENMYKE
ncbi:MAG: long-chain fatty acid--CoA ligase, partial [Syntrophus sp. (in: bacteria)]|nr:long-chain fatty acid--CoA ligase [Syntrophus sp. (in: bacteria)]PKN05700.1 MAG: long-chain fatty acid--CoA ligase [Deltaproteobacteria bacterium HGW-Deltaproteobacteria-9]